MLKICNIFMRLTNHQLQVSYKYNKTNIVLYVNNKFLLITDWLIACY